MVLNSRTGKKERITRIYQMHANKQNPKSVIDAGDICAVVGLKNLHTGDTITDIKHPLVLETIEFPELYLIQPTFPWWTDRYKTSRRGRRVPEGFEYRSDTNPVFLEGQAILELLEQSHVP